MNFPAIKFVMITETTNIINVNRQRLKRSRIYRNQPCLFGTAALDNTKLQIHIRDVQIDELGDPDSCGIKHFQHRLIFIAHIPDQHPGLGTDLLR